MTANPPARDATAQLQASDERFRCAADALRALIYEVELSADGATAVAHTYGHAHIIGEVDLEHPFTSTWWHGRIHPEDLPGHLENLRRTAADPTCTHYRTAYRVRHQDGSFREVEDSARVLRAAAAGPLRLVGAIVDVTDRNRAERALRESEATFRAMFSVSSVGKVQCDVRSGRFLRVNEAMCRITGYSEAELLERGFLELTHPDDREQDVEATARLARGEASAYDVEKRYLCKDGNVVWVHVTANVICDEQGRPLRNTAIIQDITERKHAEARLREQDQRKDEFLATLAHELRNPLAPVRNALVLMQRAGDNPAVVQRCMATMERQIGHMVRLIDDLLDVSRISQNRLDLRRSRVELAAVVQHALESCRPHLEGARHQLEVSLPEAPVLLDGDAVRLAQVLGNLLTNACKYTPAGGHIWLSAAAAAGRVQITVRDSGIGIPADMLPRVFDLFTQVERSLDRAQGGLGIGLSLVKRLVELHDGAVRAHSAGPGQGSEFIVTLPLAAAPSPPQPPPEGEPREAPAASPSKQAASGARRVLVVDDNRDNADSLALLLTHEGYEARAVYDGQRGLDEAESFRPEVLLLDLGLPSLDGYEVCRRVRARPWGGAVQVLALSGWGQDADRQRSRDAGFDDHLVKPVDPEGLLRAIDAPRRSC